MKALVGGAAQARRTVRDEAGGGRLVRAAGRRPFCLPGAGLAVVSRNSRDAVRGMRFIQLGQGCAFRLGRPTPVPEGRQLATVGTPDAGAQARGPRARSSTSSSTPGSPCIRRSSAASSTPRASRTAARDGNPDGVPAPARGRRVTLYPSCEPTRLIACGWAATSVTRCRKHLLRTCAPATRHRCMPRGELRARASVQGLASIVGARCQWQPKIAHYWQSKISHCEYAVVPRTRCWGVSDSVERACLRFRDRNSRWQ